MFRITILNLRLRFNSDTLLFFILFLLAFINLVGTLGPELGFDALWYHLTISKLYIEEGKIFFIPGNLLYYSAMPKLIELFYIPAIYVGGEILAKLVHFLFGIGTLVILYRLSRIFLSKTFSLLALVVFYSNLAVAWQSITAYIDLGRTFFEVLGLYFLVSYFKKGEDSALIKSSISIGLAVASKLLAMGSLVVLIVILYLNEVRSLKIVRFISIALLIPLPWLIFAYVNTGNPIYPFFEKIYPVSPSINVSNIINIVRSADPISPIYLIMVPLIIFSWRKFENLAKIIGIYSILSLLVWFITSQTGGGRFIMPYLPAFSLISIIALLELKEKNLQHFIIGLILIVSFTTVVYRGIANSKYLPVILGIESKHDFLSRDLNFEFGDFYDTDYYFEKNIKPTDKVLIYGTHNLYYVNVPFIHESWRKPSDKFNYVMTQNAELPREFKEWREVYSNGTTNVRLYRKD